ncbi:alpha-galactosidase-like [Papaver somniferum]|uniref:alpha-galactosidase-like n=1 Tax=Papaver somniferum TaxID=3469 RepID=UPI000E70296E|nr:alpha-galactosidase-like [Papaver somniferum]
MKNLILGDLFFFLVCRLLFIQRGLSEAPSFENQEVEANFPPRGWNSYDAFSWIISEEEFLQNAEVVSQRLLSHGYQYVVVDFLWFRKKVKGSSIYAGGFDVIDEFGRMVPDPERWPSSKGGNGFVEVAKKVHSKGLKFGIHVMRGISKQAVKANTPILDVNKGSAYEESGQQWRAKDIGMMNRPCGWMREGFMSVNTKTGAGKAFLRSLYQQYADWGVDFVKHDCVFGDDLDVDEISTVSEILKRLDHRIVYSLSPGTSATPAMAKQVSSLVNMYRVTADDWDRWDHVAAHFDVSRDFAAANMTGAVGLGGKSWPDLDMLPLGWLTDPGVNEGPHRRCNLNLDEQRTQFPFITETKKDLKRSASYFSRVLQNLKELNPLKIANPQVIRSWSANGRTGELYLAFFNLNSQETMITVRVSSLGLLNSLPVKNSTAASSACTYNEVWSRKEFGILKVTVSANIAPHGCALFVIDCKSFRRLSQ